MNKNDLITLINNMIDSPLSYLLYKIDIGKYKRLLGENFGSINNIIYNLKNFSGDISYDSSAKKIRLLCKSIINIAKYNNKIKLLDDEDIKFVKIIKKINKLDDKKIKSKSMGILQLIKNFWKYEKYIKETDTMEEIFQQVYNIINEDHEYDNIEDVNMDDFISEKNEEFDINSEKQKMLMWQLGEIELTENEITTICAKLEEYDKIMLNTYEERVNERYALYKRKNKKLMKEFEAHENDNNLTHLKNFCKKLILCKFQESTDKKN